MKNFSKVTKRIFCRYSFEKVDGNHTIEASFAEDKPKKEIYTITFDANGGVVNTPTKEVTNGDAYGELPVATKNGAFFTGWYLTKEDGNPITKDTIFDQGKDITLYAHYDYINIAVKQSLDVSKFFDDVENIVSYKVTKVDKGKATVSKKGKLKASKEGTIKVVPCIKDGKKKVTLEEKAITIIITKPKFTQKSITGKVGDKVDVSTFLEGLPANSNTVTYTIPAKKNPAKQVATVNENTGMTNLLRKGKTKLTVHVINEDKSESKITLTIKVKK